MAPTGSGNEKQCLSPSPGSVSLARLTNLAPEKPEKSKAVENLLLIQAARYEQLRNQVSEQGLTETLEKVSQQAEKKANSTEEM